MEKEELKLQIDTTITNKTLAKSISPLNVGQNMKDIVDLIPNDFLIAGDNVTVTGIGTAEDPYVVSSTGGAQNLQSVIDIGGVAEIPNKIVAYINQGDTDNKYTQFASFTNDGLSNYMQINKQGVSLYSSSLDAISYQNLQGSIKSLDGLISLTQFKGSLNTNLYFNTPIANTNIVVPAKSTIGTYTLATTDQLRPYKVYTALISQSGTNIPTVIVLENTFSGTIAWARSGPGSYSGNLMGAFIEDKTFFITTKQVNGFNDGGDDIHMSRISDNLIQLTTISQGSTTDNVINKASIEIRVYN